MRQLGGAMIGSQTGTAVGELAREVIGSADIGLPLGPEGTAALLPAGVAEFGRGLSVDAGEVRLFLALREAAHQRLFAHVPWLRAHLLGAVEQYASGISVDMARLQEAMPDVDITNPEALQRGAVRRGPVPARGHARPEGRADPAGDRAGAGGGLGRDGGQRGRGERLTHADALAEAIRRRRATGGPAERTFATLVGLELRPRRLREAARHLAGPHRGARASTAGTRCGRTRTCCPPPTTWKTRTRSCAASPNSISRTWRTPRTRAWIARTWIARTWIARIG